MKKVLVVAAHPDDEVLGCGGTIARHAAQGAEVRILILAQGLLSRGAADAGMMEALKNNSREAARILGAKSVDFAEFPDNQMDSVPLLDVVKVIEKHMAAFSPEAIYTHHSGDVNVDHNVTHRAVVTAARPVPGCSVRSLFFFEVLSSTEWQVGPGQAFVPNWYTDISASLRKKVAALEAYPDEIRSWPHPRSAKGIESLARFRGCSAGMDAAEAFLMGRHLDA